MPNEVWPMIPGKGNKGINAAERRSQGAKVFSANTVYHEGWEKYDCNGKHAKVLIKTNGQAFGGNELTVQGNIPVEEGYFKYLAEQTITAGPATVLAGIKVLLKAPEGVTLLPGFSTEQGATLTITAGSIYEECPQYRPVAEPDGESMAIMPITNDLETTHKALPEQNKRIDLSITFTNSPNPFSQQLDFQFTLPKAEQVNIVLYNQMGQVVYTHAQQYADGQHQLAAATNNLPVGMYTMRFLAGNYAITKQVSKME